MNNELYVDDLVFVGFNSRIAALHRQTGELVWNWKSPSGSDLVALLQDGDPWIAAFAGRRGSTALRRIR